MTTDELRALLPPGNIKIYAPLINGDQWLRSLPFGCVGGPYSSGYGGPLYATTTAELITAAHAKARGLSRADIENIVLG